METQTETKPISFYVLGTPTPKGSMRGFVVRNKTTGKQRAILAPDNKRSKPWMAIVNYAATEAMRADGLAAFVDQPLEVLIDFRMQRPKNHFTKKGLRPNAPPFPATKPDIDKLARCLLDALEGVCFDNDSRIVSLIVRKTYANDFAPVGATVTLGVRSQPW